MFLEISQLSLIKNTPNQCFTVSVIELKLKIFNQPIDLKNLTI